MVCVYCYVKSISIQKASSVRLSLSHAWAAFLFFNRSLDTPRTSDRSSEAGGPGQCFAKLWKLEGEEKKRAEASEEPAAVLSEHGSSANRIKRAETLLVWSSREGERQTGGGNERNREIKSLNSDRSHQTDSGHVLTQIHCITSKAV